MRGESAPADYAHASGRRSGDQFNVYICDRFVIPALVPEQQSKIGLCLDQLTGHYVHEPGGLSAPSAPGHCK
jgi:hypothetical protein